MRCDVLRDRYPLRDHKPSLGLLLTAQFDLTAISACYGATHHILVQRASFHHQPVGLVTRIVFDGDSLQPMEEEQDGWCDCTYALPQILQISLHLLVQREHAERMVQLDRLDGLSSHGGPTLPSQVKRGL